eukprot:765153-Hanusia_phi.AAC.2
MPSRLTRSLPPGCVTLIMACVKIQIETLDSTTKAVLLTPAACHSELRTEGTELGLRELNCESKHEAALLSTT